MPRQSCLEVAHPQPVLRGAAPSNKDWRVALPPLTGNLVHLREPRRGDGASLFAALSNDPVTKFISQPPATVEGFERFISKAIVQRQSGQYVCFAVVPDGSGAAAGIFQVRPLDPTFGTAEWGFALASECWGRGMFADGAELIVDFAFDVLGVHRLEARAALQNGRGNGALRKLGAVQEGVLRRSFRREGEYLDQALWAILPERWVHAKTVWGSPVIH
jgi:RimJ/RimL family protein N-acetyltransferase